QVLLGLADGLAGGRITHFLQEVEVAEGVAGLRVGGVLEEARDVREALDVGDAREVQVPAVGLRLAREGFLQVVHALAALQRLSCHGDVLLRSVWGWRRLGGSGPPSYGVGRRLRARPPARRWHSGQRP